MIPSITAVSRPKFSGAKGCCSSPSPPTKSLEVRAAQRGRVTRIDQFQQGYGNFLCITHDWFGDTFVTWYGQLASISVKIGQNVNQGDVIGIAGQSGSATEVCLFFTLQHTGKGLKNYVVDDVVDPLPYPEQRDGRFATKRLSSPMPLSPTTRSCSPERLQENLANSQQRNNRLGRRL